ncbi:Zeaxanthin epoxidase, chloroplastic [Auxenochlorella protothecoides]|nr:Zeaxanthin epoxidase, chloroplastic [Auxenochlorella protothecoides]KFM23576.1 Zeaxanthin epoxidase, chloroplastic [Auxenochlorella protothecoides]
MPGRATATDDHVCVIGAGPAGLAVAAALHQVGIPVVVLERGTGTPSSGTALGLWTNAWRALDALHAAEELRAQYREVSLVQLCREGGRLLKDFDLHSCDGGPHEFRGVRRSSLVAALAARLPPETIRYGHAVSAVAGEDQGAGVALTIEGEGSGGQMRFAGVVGADGSASVAARAAGRKPARSVGQTAVRDTELYWFVCYDTPSTKASARASAREEALRVVTGWGWGVEAAVHATPDADLARNALGDRWDIWPGAVAGAGLALTLAGDALHPMTPNLGQGACTALEDGVELARGLVRAGFRDAGSGVERAARFREAAREYEAQRRRRTLPLTLRSNLFGKILQAPVGVVAAARDAFVSRAFQPAHFLSHANYDCGRLE